MHNKDESSRYDVPIAENLLEEDDNTNYVTHVESFHFHYIWLHTYKHEQIQKIAKYVPYGGNL